MFTIEDDLVPLSPCDITETQPAILTSPETFNTTLTTLTAARQPTTTSTTTFTVPRQSNSTVRAIKPTATKRTLDIEIQELHKKVLNEEHKKIKMEQENLSLKNKKLELQIEILEQMKNRDELNLLFR